MRISCYSLLFCLIGASSLYGAPVTTTEALVAAVRDGAEGSTVEIGPGVFELEAPLEPKAGMTLNGSGMGKTILTHTAGWKPPTDTLPDPEMKTEGMDTYAYLIHNNLVSNPGRGVIWINEPYDNLVVRNNHIITRTTATPRKEGLFGLNPKCDFSTIQIVDNIIECRGQPRPLLRNDESYDAVIRNNRLTNVSDTDRYDNPQSDAGAGLQEPLLFQCGVHGELTVDGWNTRPTEEGTTR